MIIKGCQKGYIRQYWQRYNTFADGRITQYTHQVACISIVVPQQKWKNTLSNYINTRRGENIANFCFQDKELTKVRALLSPFK